MTTRDNPDGLLSRWSQRKRDVAKEAEAETAKQEQEAPENALEPETEEEALQLLRESDPELADKIEATDISKLTYEDDFTVFMSKRVPEIIRRRALAQLWMSDPILANVDGLNDYDEDFKTAAELSKTITSSWEPGRGYAKAEPEDDAELLADDAIDDDEDMEEAIAEGEDEDVSEEEVAETNEDGDVDDSLDEDAPTRDA